MKLYGKVWIVALAVTIAALAGYVNLTTPPTRVFAQAPKEKPVSDAYGNAVRDGERRFNYLREEQGGFTKVELDAQDQVTTRQSLSTSPFDTITIESTGSTGLLSSQAGSVPSLLQLEWKYGLYGSGIGLSRISVFDIDNDSTLEIIAGGSSGGGFGADDFWYVVKQTGPDTYDQIWLSDLYPASIRRIAVADVDANGIGEIYVGLANGEVYVYDGLTLAEIGSFTAAGTITALIVANADGDSSQEIIVSDGSQIYVYSVLTYALEWTSPTYGGGDLAVGNVDADPAPEIVTTTNAGHGYVIDGISHALEWDYISSFGRIVELGDIDSDGMAEIIGAASWYKITAFDADIKTPKWEIPTNLDIGALHVADTNGDNVPEILYGDGQWGSIHCYDAVTKTQNWFVSNPEHGVTDIALGDVNNDNTLEVLWGAGATSTGPDYLFVADTTTHMIEWQNVHLDDPLSAVDVGDVDDDGQDEIVMVSFESNNGYDDGIIHIFDATTHTLEWRSTDLPGINAWTGVKSVKIGDVDDDGQTEFVIATANLYDGLIQIYDGKTHTLERQSAGYYGASFTALAIGDVDNDNKTEIVVGQDREHTGATGVYLIVFDGATATEEWKSVGLDTYWGYVYDIELANVDDDSNIEIIASLAGERIYVYDGVTHQLDWLDAIPAYALEVFNVGADGDEDILIGKNNGFIDVYSASTFTLETSFNLGSGTILGLLVDDIDTDGSNEWVVSDSSKLSIFDETASILLWQNDNNMGSSIGLFNHLNSDNIDNDGNKELVLGTSFALYQFDVITTSPLALSTKTASVSTVIPGDPVTYTVTLTNGGAITLTNVEVTDTLTTSLTYINNSLNATSGSYTFNGGTISWNGDVNAGDSVTINFGATVSETVLPGLITNTAIISGGGEIITRTATVNVEPVSHQVYLPTIYAPCGNYFDDFSDPGSGWTQQDYAEVLFEYLNGEYRILSKQSSYIFFARAPTCERQNYIVEADARWVGTPGESYGLIFSIKDTPSVFFDQFYLYDMNTDFRQFRLLRYSSGGGYNTVVPITFSPAINSGTASNHLKITRNGSQITLEVNGVILGTWFDETITGVTDVGVVSNPYSYNPTSDARFDNFSITKLPDSSGISAPGLSNTAIGAGNLQNSGVGHVPIPANIPGWSSEGN